MNLRVLHDQLPKIDNPKPTIYNHSVGGLIEPSPLGQPERESNLRPILIAAVIVVILMGVIVLLSRGSSKGPATLHPYAANLKITDVKMSQAQNFVGASVTYIDGTVTNAGDKTVTHATVHVEFKNSMDQVAQIEDLPLRILQTGGPYPDAVDLAVSPLAPGQNKPFRLTFEHVSADWNQGYPTLQVSDVVVK
ncbi:MAG: DUF2393 family protein [Acidobacteriaceae bacterium]|nr:DUF2393 family protein [Acidobacteriaceae bacterium]